RLTIQKSGRRAGGQATFAQTLEQAREALSAQWSSVNDQILGQPAAAPVPGAPAPAAPDPAAALKRLGETNSPQLFGALVDALSDLAWFEIYFAEQPKAAADNVDALEPVLAAYD